MSVVLQDNLRSLLESPLEAIDLFSASVQNMFGPGKFQAKGYPEIKKSPQTKSEITKENLRVAQKLYRSVLSSTASNAIFYRLEDKKTFGIPYAEAYHELEASFWKAGSLNTFNDVGKNFSTMSALVPNTNPSNESEERKLKIIEKLKTAFHNPDQPPLSHSRSPLTSRMKQWFKKQKESLLPDLISADFHEVSDLTEAHETGKIYFPDKNHTWGVNASWALAVCQKNIKILVRSELTEENAERSSILSFKGDPHPSAFSLEIAIAIKMGYSLKIEHHPKGRGFVTFLEPPNLSRLNHFPMSYRALSDKKEQISTYLSCVLAKEIYFFVLSKNRLALTSLFSQASKEKELKERQELEQLLKQSLENSKPQEREKQLYHNSKNKNPIDIKNLIEALSILEKGNSLKTVLAQLTTDNLIFLENTFKEYPFNGYEFKALKQALTPIQNEYDLKEILLDDPTVLKTKINNCTTLKEKIVLVGSLTLLLNEKYDIDDLLKTLSPTESTKLKDLLKENIFQVRGYEALQAIFFPKERLDRARQEGEHQSLSTDPSSSALSQFNAFKHSAPSLDDLPQRLFNPSSIPIASKPKI